MINQSNHKLFVKLQLINYIIITNDSLFYLIYNCIYIIIFIFIIDIDIFYILN